MIVNGYVRESHIGLLFNPRESIQEMGILETLHCFYHQMLSKDFLNQFQEKYDLLERFYRHSQGSQFYSAEVHTRPTAIFLSRRHLNLAWRRISNCRVIISTDSFLSAICQESGLACNSNVKLLYICWS
jgi:hypothetical protein